MGLLFFQESVKYWLFLMGLKRYLNLSKNLAYFIRSKLGKTMTSRTGKMRSEKNGIMGGDFGILSCVVRDSYCACPANCGVVWVKFSNAGKTKD